MKRATWAELDRMFAKYPFMKAESCPSTKEIEEALLRLGRPKHADYVAFLERYGGAMAGPLPVLGLRPVEVVGTQWNVVEVNEYYRSRRLPGVEAWLVFSVDHGGNPIGLADDGSVWVSDHEFGGTQKLAENFEDFLRRRCLKLD